MANDKDSSQDTSTRKKSLSRKRSRTPKNKAKKGTASPETYESNDREAKDRLVSNTTSKVQHSCENTREISPQYNRPSHENKEGLLPQHAHLESMSREYTSNKSLENKNHEQDLPGLKCKKLEKSYFLNFNWRWIGAGLVVLLSIIYMYCSVYSEQPNVLLLQEFEKALHEKFSKYEELQISLRFSFEDVLSTPPQGPAVIALGFHDDEEFKKFENSLKPLVEDKLQYENIDYRISGSSPDIISDLNERLSEHDKKAVVFIRKSEKVSENALFEIHTVTDKDMFPFKNSVLIFIFISEAFEGKDNESSCTSELER